MLLLPDPFADHRVHARLEDETGRIREGFEAVEP